MDQCKTSTEWRERTAWVDARFEAVSTGPCPGCHQCGLADVDDMDDPLYRNACDNAVRFSSRSCAWCHCHLAGDREPAHGYAKGTSGRDNLEHWEVCTDCVLYSNGYDDRELGRLPQGEGAS